MLEPTAPEPDYTEAVHVFGSRGHRWKRLRTVASAAVSTNNLKRLFPLIDETVDSFLKHLEANDREKLTQIEAHSLLQKLTSAIIGRCAYGIPKVDFSSDLKHFKLFRKAFGAQPTTSFSRIDTLEWCFPAIVRLFNSLLSLIHFQSRSNPLEELNSYIGSLVFKRKSNESHPDFLQFFKNAEDSNWTGWKSCNNGFADISNAKISTKMAPGEIVAQCRFLSIAGFDTTANSVTIFLYLLAKYPHVQEKLFNELNTIESADYESLQSLKFLHATLCEALRLYPHVSPLQHRTCMEDCVIDGHLFSAGLVVQLDTWSLHHDPELWGDDVDEFHPERFLASETLPENWIPFGTGPRECIGRRFALMEEKIIAFKFLRKFRVRIASEWESHELKLSFRNTESCSSSSFHIRFLIFIVCVRILLIFFIPHQTLHPLRQNPAHLLHSTSDISFSSFASESCLSSSFRIRLLIFIVCVRILLIFFICVGFV
uniref:Cytochrome P450 n=1 Tax=Acrobeloides nanus TaxID=290746 RepID=A0A914CZF6_9BILA